MIEATEDLDRGGNWICRARGVFAYSMTELADKLGVPPDQVVLLVKPRRHRRNAETVARDVDFPIFDPQGNASRL